jgi:hypothetical protein
MTADPQSLDTDLVGPLSPPRDNGEIVFGAPWERRIFGLAVVACRSERCDWETFRKRLIRRIADDDARPYWQSWAAALVDVLEDAAVLARGELDEHQRELSSRPVGFDHRH